jgi:hypothetical protein
MLMRPELVLESIAGRKTQTRRIFKYPAETTDWVVSPEGDGKWWPTNGRDYVGSGIRPRCGLTGDCIWIRERWAALQFWYDGETGHADSYEACDPLRIKASYLKYESPRWGRFGRIVYDEGNWPRERDERGFAWRPAIHMPRWACRVVFDILDVRVERLWDVSADDALREGCVDRQAFACLWDDVNGTRGPKNDKACFAWARNRFVFVYTYRVRNVGVGAALESAAA